jgi:hypothetical protein
LYFGDFDNYLQFRKYCKKRLIEYKRLVDIKIRQYEENEFRGSRKVAVDRDSWRKFLGK